MSDDPRLQELREQISAIDREILDAVNRRVALVGEIKAHKEERGIGFLDPDRERRMLEELLAVRGRLSPEGVEELLAEVLALTKREVSKES